MHKRGLIIKKEHLDKILSGEKTIELRSSNTSVRGKINLIESGSGNIVGECVIEKSEGPFSVRKLVEMERFHKCSDREMLHKWNCTWHISSAKRYKNPIPYKHPKGAVIWVKLNYCEAAA